MKKLTIDKIKEMFEYNPKTGAIFATDAHPRFKGLRVGALRYDGALAVSVKSVSILSHRLAWLLHYGEWPKGLVVHKNKNKTDNRISNLKLVSPYDNVSSIKRYAGVSYVRTTKRWKAVINYKDKQFYLGEYENKEEALLARLAAEQCLGLHITHDKSALKWFEANMLIKGK